MDREQPPRLPLTDNSGYITREWWRWLSDMFNQVEENTGLVLDFDSATLALSEYISKQDEDEEPPQAPVSAEDPEDIADVRAIAELALQQSKGLLALFPIGQKIPWALPTTEIPPGWAVADGTGGTDDLTDRFVIGAGGLFSLDDTGGDDDPTTLTTETTALTITEGTTSVDNNLDGSTVTVVSSVPDPTPNPHDHDLDVGLVDKYNLVPYYALYWIQRIY